MKWDATYWDNRYKNNEFGWDIGYISTPLQTYFDQLKDKSIQILIPGAGNSYEAEYLFRNGFLNIDVIDFASTPLQNIQERIPSFPKDQLIQKNFFDHHGQYDLIIEQTFFCAIDPSLRKKYAEKVYELLKPNGKLVGLLFNDEFENDKPPFGGTKSEYQHYFDSLFDIKTFEISYNSIEPRMGREYFINFQKK